jgi:hypothetical protein
MYEDIYRWDFSPIQLRECFLGEEWKWQVRILMGKRLAGVRRSGPLSLYI